VTPEQEKEILFNHVIAYCCTGISFAKSKGTSPKQYGEFIGNIFKPFWNPDDGFPAFANGLMFMLAGMYPDNDMQIIEQSDKMLCFKMKNVDIAFQQGPAFGVTYEELLDCSEGILSVLGKHMNTTFSHKITDNSWYEVTLQAQ
jgi:hypothetical protein